MNKARKEGKKEERKEGRKDYPSEQNQSSEKNNSADSPVDTSSRRATPEPRKKKRRAELYFISSKYHVAKLCK